MPITVDAFSTSTELSQGENPIDNRIEKAKKNVRTAETAARVHGKSKEELIEMYNPDHKCRTPEITAQVKESNADKILKDVVLAVVDQCTEPHAPNAFTKGEMQKTLER